MRGKMPEGLGTPRIGARAARHQVGGFTLLELMVAVALIGIVLSAAIKVTGEHATTIAYLRDKTFAQWVAANKVAEVQIWGQWPRIEQTFGQSEMGGRVWHWALTVANTPDKDIRRLEVAVRREKAEQTPTAMVTAFVQRR